MWRSLIVSLALLAVASVSAAQPEPTVMSTAQKVKLTVAATLNGTPVPLPSGTLLVWSVEGDSASRPFGTFSSVDEEPASAWYAPLRAGQHTVRVSLVAGDKVLEATATVVIAVNAVIPDALTITVGTPIDR